MKVWADEQVSLMCQKSLFTYKYVNQNQSDKISGIDVREKPEGHVIVTKNEQDDLLKSARTKRLEKVMPPKSPSPEQVRDIDQDSEQSFIPPQQIQDHKMEVENLKWQIQYEKKLHEEMGQLLENKVSHLMAEVKQLNKTIVELQQKVEAQDAEKTLLKETIDSLEARVTE